MLVIRALNPNQQRILRRLAQERTTATRLARRLYQEQRCPVSTTKLNLSILRNLGIITYGRGSDATLTGFGRRLSCFMTEGGETDGHR